MGWRTRERGRPRVSTVAALHQTMRCAISTKAGATRVRSIIGFLLFRARRRRISFRWLKRLKDFTPGADQVGQQCVLEQLPLPVGEKAATLKGKRGLWVLLHGVAHGRRKQAQHGR